MKKIIVLLLTALIALALLSVTVTAGGRDEHTGATPDEPTVQRPTDVFLEPTLPTDPYSVEEVFVEWLRGQLPDFANDGVDCTVLYRSEGDWALIRCYIPAYEPWLYVGHFRIGSRVLTYWRPGAAFYPYGLFIYDMAEDIIFPVSSETDTQRYELERVLERLGIGAIYGDADADGFVTILDATWIQRLLASMIDEDEISHSQYASADVDEDDSVTIMDATRIQRYLAGLCELYPEQFVPEPEPKDEP